MLYLKKHADSYASINEVLEFKDGEVFADFALEICIEKQVEYLEQLSELIESQNQDGQELGGMTLNKEFEVKISRPGRLCKSTTSFLALPSSG